MIIIIHAWRTKARVHDNKFIEKNRQTKSCEKVHDHQRSWQLTRFIWPRSRNKGIRSMKMIWNISSALRIEIKGFTTSKMRLSWCDFITAPTVAKYSHTLLFWSVSIVRTFLILASYMEKERKNCPVHEK